MQESTVNRDDPKVWGIGGRIDFQGFRIGASWMDRDSQEAKTTGVTAAAGQETLELGARYTFGPNAVSITRLAGETTATSNAAGDGDETTVTHLAYRRTLGPGVSWTLTAIFADYENGLAGAAASTSNDGQALVTSVKIRF